VRENRKVPCLNYTLFKKYGVENEDYEFTVAEITHFIDDIKYELGI